MPACFVHARAAPSVPLRCVEQQRFSSWVEHQDEHTRRWLRANGFEGARDTFCSIPDAAGDLASVAVGIESADDPWCLGSLPYTLPEGAYRLEADWPAERLARASVGWGLGAYRFTRYRAAKREPARLVLDGRCDGDDVERQVAAIALARDLINTPAEDMMPEQLGAAAAELGRELGAEVRQVVGEELLAANYPAVHAVGRASAHAPRLIDLRWGDPAHPKVTLVGKGVCFDSGGLDLKNASGMRLMKKDMGGAAHAIALARLAMSARLPVRLRLLVPAVENAVAGNAFRPGDVLRTRKGLSVEIDNTDAEGRVILSDALAEASAERPALLVDFATLTGAARVALGTELPALFANDDALASALLEAALSESDPMWRLPLHAPYRELIDSKIADLANAADTPYAGAITAALFLESFVDDGVPWAHFDLMAWNVRGRPGRPEGGEAMGLRALYRHLRRCFAE